MTENQFQAARKIMQQANHLRGLITKKKREIAKWTKIEDCYRRDLKESQAEGAKKCLVASINNLALLRDKFAALQFPTEDCELKYKWIIAIDTDSFICGPIKLIGEQITKAEKDGFFLYDSLEACQNVCDCENSL